MKEERERGRERERLKSVRQSSCPAVTHTGWREVGKGMEAVHRQARDRERFTFTFTWPSVRSDRKSVTVRERERDSETDIQTGRQIDWQAG